MNTLDMLQPSKPQSKGMLSGDKNVSAEEAGKGAECFLQTLENSVPEGDPKTVPEEKIKIDLPGALQKFVKADEKKPFSKVPEGEEKRVSENGISLNEEFPLLAEELTTAPRSQLPLLLAAYNGRGKAPVKQELTAEEFLQLEKLMAGLEKGEVAEVKITQNKKDGNPQEISTEEAVTGDDCPEITEMNPRVLEAEISKASAGESAPKEKNTALKAGKTEKEFTTEFTIPGKQKQVKPGMQQVETDSALREIKSDDKSEKTVGLKDVETSSQGSKQKNSFMDTLASKVPGQSLDTKQGVPGNPEESLKSGQEGTSLDFSRVNANGMQQGHGINAQPSAFATDSSDAPALWEGISQVVQVIKNTEGKKRGILRIDPPELGKIKITIDSLDDKVDIHLTVESPDAKDILKGSEDMLRDSLKRQGLAMGDLSVDVGNQEKQENANADKNITPAGIDTDTGAEDADNEEDRTPDARIDLHNGVLHWVA